MATQIPENVHQTATLPAFSDIPLHRTRSILAHRPTVLLTTRHDGADNVMTLAHHRVPEDSPHHVACVIASGTRSHALLLAGRACAINVPGASMSASLDGIGACSGALYDKFTLFGLARAEAGLVDAPVLPQCLAQLECRLSDDRAARRYGLFMLEVVRLRIRLALVERPDRRAATDTRGPPSPAYSSSSMSQ